MGCARLRELSQAARNNSKFGAPCMCCEDSLSETAAAHRLVLICGIIAGWQSFSRKSERSQKFKATLTARKLERCVSGNVVGETIGQPENGLRRKLLAPVGDHQAAWLRSWT